MGDEIRDPRRNLPIAIFLGGAIAGFIYLGTTLSMLIAMPQKEIGVLSGVLQAINVMSTRAGLMGLVPPLALLECIAILGTASAWFSGSARPALRSRRRSLLTPDHWPRASPLPHAVREPDLFRDLILALDRHQLLRSLGRRSLSDHARPLAVILQLSPSAYMFLALLKHTWTEGVVLNANKTYLTASTAWPACVPPLLVWWWPSSRRVRSIPSGSSRPNSLRSLLDRFWLGACSFISEPRASG